MLLMIINVLLSPYTKVEESFNIQALHDFIFTKDLNDWDHLEFPGVVPRTFTGALALYVLGFPIYCILGALKASKVYYLIMGRIILGILNWTSQLGYYSKEYSILEICSFHINFWGSRTIPNSWALILTNFAFYFQLKQDAVSGLTSLAIYVFTAVVFRAEIAVLGSLDLLIGLGGLVILSDLYYKKYRLGDAIMIFVLIFILSLLWTTSLDSYLWKSRFCWPEWNVFIFNTFYNGSKNYGVSPWNTYFLKMLPKIAPIAYPVGVSAFFSKDERYKRILAPVFLYIFIYSFLPHKEWRFIMYTVTPLQYSASIYMKSFRISSKLLLKIAAGIMFILSIFAMVISSFNYPGGVALSKVPVGSVYIDTFTAMNGASRFGQKFPCRPWFFSQDCYSEPLEPILSRNNNHCPSIHHQKLIFMNTCILRLDTYLNNSSRPRKVIPQNVPKYDKNESQTNFMSYTYILTHEPNRFPNRKVYDVIYGYDGLGYTNNLSLFQGIRMDLKSLFNFTWSNIVGPIRLVPKVWILKL